MAAYDGRAGVAVGRMFPSVAPGTWPPQHTIAWARACRAKNYVPGKEAQSTKVAAAVIELQRSLPMARTVYCSATGVSEVGHMAYMERMGLWGPGSAFPDFEAFLDSMKHRGVSFLEMLAMELKSEGKYVARGLSFRQAEFAHQPCRLSDEQARCRPRTLAKAWLEPCSRVDANLAHPCVSLLQCVSHVRAVPCVGGHAVHRRLRCRWPCTTRRLACGSACGGTSRRR